MGALNIRTLKKGVANLGALKRLVVLAAGLAAMSSMASAYYYWTFLGSGSGALAPVPGHFDLTQLQDNTVQYFISTTGPTALVAGDSDAAIYSQIRQAASVWNNVSTSAIRLAFGGFTDVTTPQATPGIDVVFDDNMPPGILAQSMPTFPADLSLLSAKGTTFVPITRSRLQLRANLAATGMEQPSYSDTFFLTLVHEFGHTLGLQHTTTSSVMSTSITRGTMKGTPLAADDIAGISLLYPVAGYTATTGSITGLVVLGASGVNMASVVALSPNGTAVSALTNPDGTYRIDGIPPGQYYVYVQPLPPPQTGEVTAANIIPPVNPAGGNYAATTGIDTQFFPAVKNWTQAALFPLAAGQVISQVNFGMSPRSAPSIYDITTYGYRPGAVSAPPLKSATTGNPLVFTGAGIVTQTASGPIMTPGLNVTVIGGAASSAAGSAAGSATASSPVSAASIEPATLGYYTDNFLLMRLDTAAVTSPTPAALAMTLGDDLYVLPSAFTVEPADLPQITQFTPSLAADGTAQATIVGTNLGPTTKIQFDGAPGSLLNVNADGSWLVAAPPAPSAQLATIEAINGDGQTSMQGQLPANRPLFAFPLHAAPTVSVLPASIVAGTDGFIVIEGLATHFAQGQTVLGFGTSDVSVRQVWVLGPGFLVANVTVNPQVTLAGLPVTVSTGLEVITLPAGIKTVAPAAAGQLSLHVPVLNASTGLAGVPAGGTGLVRTSGLTTAAAVAAGTPPDLTGWSVLIGGIKTSFIVDVNGVIAVQIPANMGLGAQLIQVFAPDGTGPQPIIMQVDPPPPVIVSAFDNTALNGAGAAVAATAPANPGDVITLTVTGLDWTPGVWINVAGVNVKPLGITAPDKNGNWLVQFTLPSALPYNAAAAQQTVPVMIGIGTRLSAAFTLNVNIPPPPVVTPAAAVSPAPAIVNPTAPVIVPAPAVIIPTAPVIVPTAPVIVPTAPVIVPTAPVITAPAR